MATAYWYGGALKKIFDGTGLWDFDTDTFKISLHTSSYTPNQDTHVTTSDLTNELSSGGGYTTGGETLTTTAVAYDGTSNEIRFTFDDPSWTSATLSGIRYAVIYRNGGTNPLLAYVDLGSDQAVTSGTFTLDFSATAALKITVS